jgi:hypothetical protein
VGIPVRFASPGASPGRGARGDVGGGLRDRLRWLFGAGRCKKGIGVNKGERATSNGPGVDARDDTDPAPLPKQVNNRQITISNAVRKLLTQFQAEHRFVRLKHMYREDSLCVCL